MSETDALSMLMEANEKYKGAILEFNERKKRAEEAEAKAAEEQHRLTQVRQETEYTVAKGRNEIETAQKTHDERAREAAARIQVANGQIQEVLAQRAAVELQAKELDRREAALNARHTQLSRDEAAFAQALAEFDQKSAKLKSQLAKAEDFIREFR